MHTYQELLYLELSWIQRLDTLYLAVGRGARADARAENCGRFFSFLRARGRSTEVWTPFHTSARVRVGGLGGHGACRHDVRTTCLVDRSEIDITSIPRTGV